MTAPSRRPRPAPRAAPALAAVTALLVLGACTPPPQQSRDLSVPGGDAERGRTVYLEYGCASCHATPDVPSVRTGVGPDLDELPDRLYLAGQIPNRPEELIRWIRHPQQIVPGTLMPDLGVTEQDARDIAAFLYSLP